jgi:hypothetical protein
MIVSFNEMHGFYQEFQAILSANLCCGFTADQTLFSRSALKTKSPLVIASVSRSRSTNLQNHSKYAALHPFLLTSLQ